jgi:hypothetical protein
VPKIAISVPFRKNILESYRFGVAINNRNGNLSSKPNNGHGSEDMQNIIWQSEPIKLSDAVSVEVHVTDAAVILGETANHVFAADLELTPEAAIALADVLTQGAVKCLDAAKRGGK